MTEHPLVNYPRPPPGSEDLPFDDGEPMETILHRDQMHLLIYSLGDNRARTTLPPEQQDFFIGGNNFVYFSEPQAKGNDFRGPDFFAVIGRPQCEVKSWVAWEQDGRLPDIVIELLSPKTEAVDRGLKFEIYRDRWKVRRYYLYDPFTEALEGYALVEGKFVRIEPNARGRLECAPLGLELGVRQTDYLQTVRPMLRWFDRSGRPLEMGGARIEALEARAKEAEALRIQAEALRIQAEADRERAEADRERAEADRERAEADRERAEAEVARERARAEEEKARGDALERRLAELEGRK